MTKRRKAHGGVTGGGAYKKGGRFKIALKPRTDTVYPGIVTTPQELNKQYQIMLALKGEAQKQLRLAQQVARKLEKRENLLQLAEQVDAAVTKLEESVGALHRILHLLVDFGNKPPVLE